MMSCVRFVTLFVRSIDLKVIMTNTSCSSLTANAQANRQDPSQQLQVCHEDHGRCIRDATYQNCKLRPFIIPRYKCNTSR